MLNTTQQLNHRALTSSGIFDVFFGISFVPFLFEAAQLVPGMPLFNLLGALYFQEVQSPLDA